MQKRTRGFHGLLFFLLLLLVQIAHVMQPTSDYSGCVHAGPCCPRPDSLPFV